MILFPPCKINLGLHVLEKRQDGFHEIETLFFPLPLTDILEIIPSSRKESTLSISGINIPPDEKKNLCMRAYELIAADYRIPTVQIHLHKNIPIGAGLGGGSADATYTLILLNKLFELEISKESLIKYATVLGSDCAFFLHNEPCLAKGRGEILSPYPLYLANYHIILVKPPVHVATRDAYAGIVPFRPARSINEIIKLPVSEWKEFLLNDFEKTVFTKFPQIHAIKEELYDAGALYASMSGSGASVFGIFEQNPVMDRNQIFKDCFVWESTIQNQNIFTQ